MITTYKALKHGQHLIEYLVVLAAIVAAIIVGLRAVIPGRVANYVETSAAIIANSAP